MKNNFYIYAKRDKEGKVNFAKPIKITEPLKEVQFHGFRVVLHRANEGNYKDYIFSEQVSGISLGSGKTLKEAEKRFEEITREYTKTEYVKSVMKYKSKILDLVKKCKTEDPLLLS